MAAFASAPPDPLLPSPDPQDALIQAVQAGDAAAAARWLQRWVHRRGVASLDPLVARVASLEGPEAAEWLRGQLEQPLAASRAPAPVPPALSVAEPTAEPAVEPSAVVESPAVPVVSVEPLAEPRTAPEARPEPVAAAGSEEPAEPLPARQDAPAALEFAPLEFELPSFQFPPFELPALEPPVDAAQGVSAAEAEAPAAAAHGSATPSLPAEWSLDLETAFPPLGRAIGNSPSGLETAAVPDPTAAHAAVDSDQTVDPATASPRRNPFARMKSLVRGCLEEAREVFHRFDSAELDGEAEEEEESFEAEEPQRQPVQAALPEIPSFLAEGAAAPPSPAPGTAAPAPSALSDLRSWLPEAEDQLPRAS